MSSDVAVAILAGGEGRRIGGEKPLRILAGERLIDRALRHARSWSERLAVCVREPGQLGSIGAPLLIDRPGIGGPIAGLAAALEFAQQSGSIFLLTIPTDVPFLPDDLLGRLMAAIGEEGCAVAESGGRLHPACALWRVSAAVARIEPYCAGGGRSLRGLAEQIGVVPVSWAGGSTDPFFNINDMADLAEAERRISR